MTQDKETPDPRSLIRKLKRPGGEKTIGGSGERSIRRCVGRWYNGMPQKSQRPEVALDLLPEVTVVMYSAKRHSRARHDITLANFPIVRSSYTPPSSFRLNEHSIHILHIHINKHRFSNTFDLWNHAFQVECLCKYYLENLLNINRCGC